ncbi:MAG: hypothetical protein MJZ64_06940 [Paludibacteraceae bacterium]|nr:hypothetical protein [Paludibacteraceae bacterium]
MTKEQTFIIDTLLAELVQLIMKYQNVDMQTALDTLYNSSLYEKIMDIETGLYLQSADYNYELINHHI